MTDAAESLRFPLGRFARQPSYTDAERASHIERLATQPARLAAAISGFTDLDWGQPYRPGGWTVLQLVHHMADSHLNAYTRIKLGLTEVVPTIKPYDQDAWVTLPDSALSPLVSLALLEATHTRLVAVLQGTDVSHFTRTVVHPDSGTLSVDDLVALYAWHGDHHIAQLAAYRARRDAAASGA